MVQKNEKCDEQPLSKPAMVEYIEADLDFKIAKEQKLSSQPSSSRQTVTRPEPTSFVYVACPQSKYNPETHAKPQVQGDPHQRIAKRLKQLKRSKKKALQAQKPSAEGCRVLLSL
ncbi:hypothetical protein QUC31_011740 [Theobroma cacao]